MITGIKIEMGFRRPFFFDLESMGFQAVQITLLSQITHRMMLFCYTDKPDQLVSLSNQTVRHFSGCPVVIIDDDGHIGDLLSDGDQRDIKLTDFICETAVSIGSEQNHSIHLSAL